MIEINSITDIVLHLEGIKTIIFDMDDTLYGEKEYVRSGYKCVSECVPNIDKAEEKLLHFFVNGKNAIDELLMTEGIYTDELKTACIKAYRYQVPDIHLYPGVKEMLISLKQQGYNIGIITDGRVEGQEAKIKALQLDKLVDKIIITDSLGSIEFRKPCTKSYILMSEYFNTNYSDMIYVGDNPKKDFIACEKLGIRAVYFVNQDGLYSQ